MLTSCDYEYDPDGPCTVADAIAVAARKDFRLAGVQVFSGGLATPEDGEDPYPYVVIGDLSESDPRRINWRVTKGTHNVRIRVYACDEQAAVMYACAMRSIATSMKCKLYRFGSFCVESLHPAPYTQRLGSDVWRATVTLPVVTTTVSNACSLK